MTFAPDAMTMNAPRAAADFGWERHSLAGFAARFVDLGGFIVEVDGLTAGELGQGRGGLPCRRLVLAPIDYVRAIVSSGLNFEGEFARRLTGQCIVGGSDFDYAHSLDMFDARFNSSSEMRLRVRTLDRHLKNLPQPSLLVFGGFGVRPDILRSGRKTIVEHLPIIVVRPVCRDDLDAFSTALREVEPSYEWVMRPGGGSMEGAEAGDRPYYVAAPARRKESAGAVLSSSAELFPGRETRDWLRTSSALRATPHRISPEMLIASSGFYSVEAHDGKMWRWGGVLPKLSLLIEAPGPGLYEIRTIFAFALPGSVEAVEGIKVNGALLIDPNRDPAALTFSVTSRIGRHVHVEIDCPHRRTAPGDPRQLSIALAEIRLRQLPL